MNSIPETNAIIPTTANYVRQGEGPPVIMIHGVAASLHDWDDLSPELAKEGYASYALDLLGHGDSPRLDSRAYQMDWLFEHFLNWMNSLHLTQPAILVGHSLGGYIALEYALLFAAAPSPAPADVSPSARERFHRWTDSQMVVPCYC